MTAVILAAMLMGQVSGPAVIDDQPDTGYVSIRRDVLEKLNQSDKELPLCKQALEKANKKIEALTLDYNLLLKEIETTNAKIQEAQQQPDWSQPVIIFSAGFLAGGLQSLAMAWIYSQI